MARDREEVRREIEETRQSLSTKLGKLSARMDGAREKVERARAKVNVRHRVRERPWVAMGLSVVAGVLLYRARRSWRTRGAAITFVEVTRAAQAAEHLGEARDGDGAAAGERGGALVRRPARRDMRHRIFGVVARAAMGGLTRTLVSSLAERMRHGARGGEALYGPERVAHEGPAAQPDYPEPVGTALRGAPR